MITLEEAIKELRDASDSEVRYGDTEYHYDKVMKRVEAFEMAIKALEQQPNRCDSCTYSEEQDGSNCYECIKGMADNFEAQPTDADCISRAEVLNLLKGIEILHNHDELRTNLIYGIMSLSPVTPQQTRWIPVSEGLPEKNVWVLVTVEQNGNRYQEIMKRNKYIEAWTDNIDNYTDVITAWMPLPEPYKTECDKQYG